MNTGFSDLIVNIVIALVSGLLSGFISGSLVFFVTKKREQNIENYHFWVDYLFGQMEKNEVYIPSELLRRARAIGDEGSVWYKTINKIIEADHPHEFIEREFSSEGTQLAKNVLTALEELSSWARKKRIGRIKKRLKKTNIGG